MGKKGPLTWVDAQEFKLRTALRMSSRSPSTLRVDAAYAAYLASDSEYKRKQLYTALRDYLIEHGSSWNACERNTVSGGLLEWVYNQTAPASVRITTRRAAELDFKAQAAVMNTEIPHSRFGVLYFLGNIQLEMDLVSVAIEGVAVAGGAVGMGMSTDFNNTQDVARSGRVAFNALGQEIKAGTVVGAGTGVLAIAQMANTTAGTVAKTPVPPPPSPSWFPCTEAALTAATTGISDTYDHNKYFGVAAGVGAAVVAVPVLAATLTADAAKALYRAGKAFFELVGRAVKGVWDMLKAKWAENSNWFASTGGAVLKAATKFVLDLIMKQAAPFIGGAIDLGTGVVRAIDDACTRIASYLDRRKIRLMPGHAEETANSIEHAMTMGLFKGLADVLKGAGKTAVGVFLPGLGGLVTALMSALEWLIKFIYRMVEADKIEKFLLKARIEYQEVKERATVKPANPELGIKRQTIEPKFDGVGIINKTDEFTKFFKEGCDASPIIPMLTLNSGLCGSLMTLVKLFDDDTGAQSHNGGGRQEFDTAGDFFHRLKLYSSTYLQTCGFQFKPLDPNDELLRGYLNHAVFKGHVAPVTVGTRLLAAARA